MRFEKHITAFSQYLHMKGYSDRTLESYTYELSKFSRFIEEHFPRIKAITQIGKDILLDYSHYLSGYTNRHGNPLSGKTIKVKIASLKHFFKYLAKHDIIISNPSLILETPKEEKSLPRSILTEQEVMDILNSIPLHSPINIRNKAIVELFYSTGMRTSELCDLKIADVDLKEQMVFIYKGKGNKSRVVPCGQHCIEYIRLYLDKARKFMLRGKHTDEGYLFLSQRGNRFSRDSINACVIRQVMKKVNIDKNVSCYTLRHSCATHLVKNHVDIRYVSELLGHESLKTTQKYYDKQVIMTNIYISPLFYGISA